MKAKKLRTIVLIILLATQLFAQTRPAVELEGAIAKEQVDGDLKTAIAIYQKIAADTSAPRDLRAKALLHLGRCYEKLGQQAQTVYRQIVRDFGDQPEAVQAKASRLLRIAYPSRDDLALYEYRPVTGGEGERELLRWEIATGRETILERFSIYYLTVSRDERWLIRSAKRGIEIRPTSGGDWKSLVSLDKKLPEGLGQFNDTPDGNWLLYHDIDSAGKHSLFRVPTAGGTPERLGDFPSSSPYGTMDISPDGSKIIISAGEFASGYELWSLENFVPPAPKR